MKSVIKIQSGFATIPLILIVLAIITAIGGYFTWRISVFKPIEFPNVPVVVPPYAQISTSSTSTSTSIDTSNWKTYRNEKYNYSISYPSDYTLQVSKTADCFSAKPDWFEGSSLCVFPHENPKKMSAREWWKTQEEGSSSLIEAPSIVVAGQHALVFESEPNALPSRNIVFTYSDKVFVIDSLIQYEDEMLSSFKFIELSATSVDTSTWKTYRNEQYGFEVKYPKEWGTHESNSLFSGEQTFMWSAASPDYRFGELYPCRGSECAPPPYGVIAGRKLYLTIFTKARPQTFNDLTHIVSFGKELDLPSFDYSMIQVGSQKAISYRYPIQVDDPDDCSTTCMSPDGLRVRFVSPRSPTQVIEVLLSGGERDLSLDQSASQDLFNKILSTFKFIEPSASAPNADDAACMNEWKKQFVYIDVTTPEGFGKVYEQGQIEIYFKDGTTEAAAKAWLQSEGLPYTLINVIQGSAYSVGVRVPNGQELAEVCRLKKAPLVRSIGPLTKPVPPPVN